MKIEFSTSGSIFEEPYKTIEVCRILEKITRQVEDGYDHGPIMDINGNKIGTWEL